MLQNILKKFKDLYSFSEVDNKEYKSFKMSEMDFVTESYDLAGLGHQSVMKASGMMGLMEMESIIINPFEVDAPLLSIDRIKAMGNDSIYLEVYDTLLNASRDEAGFESVKQKYQMLNDIDYTSHWYDHLRYQSSILKKVSTAESHLVDECVNEYLDVYLELVKKAEVCDKVQKKLKAKEYSDGLLEHGGPATDPFLKTWGKEKTAELFNEVLFG